MTRKISLLTILFLFTGIICTIYEDKTCITSIPESTLYAYRETRAVDGKFQAVFEAWIQAYPDKLTQKESAICLTTKHF
jgi:hypothetical protein